MSTRESEFSKAYHEVRRKEGWIDEDSVVRRLPFVPRNHPRASDWRVRATTADRLVRLIGRGTQPQRILDVGCGNGWLSSRLARACSAHVLGIDIATHEIEQARRVWKDEPNVTFSLGSIPSRATTCEKFDVVIFCASMQYMPNARLAIASALELLHPGGFVVVADTPWYSSESAAAARARSVLHYQSMEVPNMALWYYHHELRHLEGLNWRIIPLNLLTQFTLFVAFGARPRFDIIKIMNAE